MSQLELLETMLEDVSKELSFERPKYRFVDKDDDMKIDKARFHFIPRTLVLNESWFKDVNEVELYARCIKELRYAYQVDSILNDKNEDPSTLASWRKFLNVYTNPKHEERKKITVLTNPMEIDAITFAQSYMEKHFGVKLELKNLTNKHLYQQPKKKM